VIDAFIKGISEITVAFNQLNTVGNIEEVLAAGEILGVRVNLGVEFSVLTQGHRFHFMFLLPPMRTSAELAAFTARHGERPEVLHRRSEQEPGLPHRLHPCADRQLQRRHLPALNDGYEAQSQYVLPALDLEAIEEIVPMEGLTACTWGSSCIPDSNRCS